MIKIQKKHVIQVLAILVVIALLLIPSFYILGGYLGFVDSYVTRDRVSVLNITGSELAEIIEEDVLVSRPTYYHPLMLESIDFYGFAYLLIFCIILVISWKIDSKRYFRCLHFMLSALTVLFLLGMILSIVFYPYDRPSAGPFPEYLEDISIFYPILFLTYLILAYLLFRTDWYANSLILIGGFLTLISLAYLLFFLIIALDPGSYRPDYPYDEHKFLFRDVGTFEYLLCGTPIMLVYLLCPLLILTMGCVKKINKPGWWNKLPRYEVIAIVLLFIIQLVIWLWMTPGWTL